MKSQSLMLKLVIMVRKVLTFPDPSLRQASEEVKEFNDNLKKLVDDMLDTMYEYNGIGLAAPQIGVHKRVIIIDVGQIDGERNPMVIVNGKIVHREGKIEFEEGCLSVPGIREVVKRNLKVKLKGRNLKGEEIEIEGEGLLAVALQHELDHLDGILFIDRLPRTKREAIKKMLTENRMVLEQKH